MSEGSTTLTETRRLALRDDHVDPIDPKRRTVTFIVRTKRSAPGNRVVAPARGSTGDPTLHGESIVANSAGSNERVRVDLPAAGWRVLGTSLKPKGFAFRDASSTAPIATVVVKTDALSVKGKGPGWDYTLDEAQGRVGVRVRLATSPGVQTPPLAPAAHRRRADASITSSTNSTANLVRATARVPDLRHAVARRAPSNRRPPHRPWAA